MPSFLGRLLGLDFRTERLIMNLLGLVNSTLDWSPIKWTNKLEQIWNMSLSQGTLILDIIGEDRIKTVLSWIVITRIIIAHVYTFSYMTNIYPILTWSRPNLLLPWLILSFFKNIVLEVIVIAVGLLLWYDKRFSLAIFFEFVLVKVVPLVFASYNWYSNSCLFLELRYMEKMRRLRRRLRSDSNLLVTRLYLKMADSKYRTRSLTTLISCESYETSGTHDTISLILDDPRLSPVQKTMRILGVTEQDINEARVRVKNREVLRRLTAEEEEDELFMRTTKDITCYFSFDNEYDWEIADALKQAKDEGDVVKEEGVIEETARNEVLGIENATGQTLMDQSSEDIASRGGNGEDDASRGENGEKDDSRGENGKKDDSRCEIGEEDTLRDKRENDKVTTIEDAEDKIEDTEAKARESLSSLKDTTPFESPRGSKGSFADEAVEQDSHAKKRGAADTSDASKSRQTKLSPSCHAKDLKQSGSVTKKRDPCRIYSPRHAKRSVEKSCSPVKLQALLNCNCAVDDYLFKEKIEEYCLLSGIALRTSTPNASLDNERMLESIENTDEVPKNATEPPRRSPVSGDKSQLARSNSLPLIEKLLKNDLSILKNVRKDEQTSEEVHEEVIAKMADEETNVYAKRYTGQRNVAVGAQNLAEIVKDLSVTDLVTSFDAFRSNEPEGSGTRRKTENEFTNTIIPVPVADSNSATSTQSGNLACCKTDVEKNLIKLNFPEYSFGDSNIPRFYKDSMKVFDGCYEKDFDNNSELQCVLQQLEKKKWSMYSGQSSQEAETPSTYSNTNDPKSLVTAVENLKAQSLVSDSEKTKGYKTSVSPSSKSKYENLISRIVQVSEQVLSETTRILNNVGKPSSTSLIRDVCTQTDNLDNAKSSSTSLSEARKRRKMFLKRKRLKEQSRSVSPICCLHGRNAESRSSLLREQHQQQQLLQPTKPPSRQKPIRPNDHQQRKLSSPKKQGNNKNSCECQTQQVDSRHSFSDSRGDSKKCSGRCKVDNLGTIPLSQVVRPPMFDSLVFRRKPPAYPKSGRSEVPAPSTASSVNSKKTIALRKLLEESKKPTEKQSSYNAKKTKGKGRLESLEEQEMKALKAYNEVTLLKDKKELEAKRKMVSTRRNNTVDSATAESSKSRPSYQRRTNQERVKRDASRGSLLDSTYDTFPGKENMFADATTETEPLLSVPIARESKAYNSGRLSSAEKYSCSKLTKVNRVTDKLLENFDRLHGGQLKQDTRKNKVTVETDTRKQYTKYSKPKKTVDEENVSTVSIKKLEGVQTGRELERTTAKQNVRDPSPVPEATTSVATRSDDLINEVTKNDRTTSSSAGGGTVVAKRDDDLLTTIKSTASVDVASSLSSNTVDQGEGLTQLPVNADPSVENETQTGKERKEVRVVRETGDHEKVDEEILEAEKKREAKDESTTKPEGYHRELTMMLETKDRTTRAPATPEMEDPAEGIRAVPQPEDDRKTKVEAKPIIEDRPEEEVEESKISTDSSSTESSRRTEQIEDEPDIDEASIDGLVVLGNEVESGTRSSVANVMHLVRNIGMSYMANGASNASILSWDDPHQWDILEEKTVKKLHNAYSYRPVDTSSDVLKEILDMDNALNDRRSKSSVDEFIFELDGDLLGANLENVPPSGREANSFEQTLLATIQQFQNLDLGNQDEDTCNLFITTIDHGGGLPVAYEIDTANQDNEEMGHAIVNELRVTNPLSFMTWFLDNPSAIELNAENGSRDRLEIIQDDEEELEQAESEEQEVEGYEETEERSIKEERMLEFIKKDILTDIRFPVVVSMTDLIPDTLGAAEEYLEELNVTLYQRDPSKINLFSMSDNWGDVEAGDEVDEAALEDILRDTGSKEVRKAAEPLKSVWKAREPALTSISGYEVAEKVVNAETTATRVMTEESAYGNTFAKLMNRVQHTMYPARPANLCDADELLDEIRENYEIIENLEEIERPFRHEVVEESGKNVVPCQVVEKSVELTEIEQNSGFDESEITDEIVQIVRLESEENEEARAMESEDMLENESVDAETEEKDVESEEAMSLTIIFTFWLLVISFYFRHLRQRIFSLREVSATMMSLKPFEVHTVPTSTTSILEKPEYIGKMEQENEREVEEEDDGDDHVDDDDDDDDDDEDEEEDADSDSMERTTDLEVIEVSRSTEYYSLLNVGSTFVDSARVEHEDSFNEFEVNDTMLYLSDRVENLVEDPTSSVEATRGLVSAKTKLQKLDDKEEEVEVRFGSFKMDEPDLRFQLPSIANVDRPIVELDERRLFELRLAGEEIETFRYQDDDFSSSKSLLIPDEEMKFVDNTEVIPVPVEMKDEEKEQEGDPRTEKASSKGDSILELTYKIEDERPGRSSEEDTAVNEQPDDPDKTILSQRSIEEASRSTERKEPSLGSPEVSGTRLETNDSFDSTYTRGSETSGNSVSIIGSLMEEFKIVSSESIVDD